MQIKHLLGIPVLTLMVALGLAAFAAAGASAVNLKSSEWEKGSAKVLGVTNETLKPPITGAFGLSVLKVPALSFEMHCAKGSVVSATFLNLVKGEILGTFLFEKCKTYPIDKAGKLTSETELSCFVANGGVNRHVTAVGLGLLIKHQGVKYLVVEPDGEGKALTTITYEAGKECPLPLKQEVKGNYAFEVSQAEEKVLSVTAGNQTLQELLGTKLLYGVNEATLTGSGTTELTGAHAGCTWGVV